MRYTAFISFIGDHKRIRICFLNDFIGRKPLMLSTLRLNFCCTFHNH
jgi:hypothetical protein